MADVEIKAFFRVKKKINHADIQNKHDFIFPQHNIAYDIYKS